VEIITLENELVSQQLEIEKVFSPMGLEAVIVAIEEKARATDWEVSTTKGRAAIGSVCAKISSSKVFLDNAGKKFIEDLKLKIKPVDAERKRMRDRLDALKEEINKPRAEWEEAERLKIEAEELEREKSVAHDEALAMEAWYVREREISRKEAEFARIEAERKAKEEIERQEKEQAERDEQIRIDAETKAKKESEAALAAAKVASEDAEKARLLAIEQARIDQEAAVLAAKQEAKEQADKIEMERVEAERAEKERVARLDREREEKADEERLVAEKKASNLKHQASINNAAMAAFIAGGLPADYAKLAVILIASKTIPAISVHY
jgi:colicin import membrane protein